MRINTLNELDPILSRCRATKIGEPTDGQGFYKVMRQEFLYPDGKVQAREYLDKKPASVVVPVTADDHLVFVIQPIGLAEEGSLLELPAGYWNFNEDGETAAKREMAEETGYMGDTIICTGTHYQDPGSIRQKVTTYLALDVQPTGKQKLDQGEFIKYVEISVNLIPELLTYGYISDANTFIALIRAARVMNWRIM